MNNRTKQYNDKYKMFGQVFFFFVYKECATSKYYIFLDSINRMKVNVDCYLVPLDEAVASV